MYSSPYESDSGQRVCCTYVYTLLPLSMQAKCDSLQERLTHAVEESEARRKHEQIMVQQMNVRSGLVHVCVCVCVCVCIYRIRLKNSSF